MAEAAQAAEYEPGEMVRVREDFPIGHFRTPTYLRGKTGRIVRKWGQFDNPELLAYALRGPKKALYEVQFAQADLWPSYNGPIHDTLAVDIYEHWLEKI